jgi:hypothetical protein
MRPVRTTIRFASRAAMNGTNGSGTHGVRTLRRALVALSKPEAPRNAQRCRRSAALRAGNGSAWTRRAG